MHYWYSPTVIIDQCSEGSELEGKFLPDWYGAVGTELRFWQGRILMLEMLLYFARNIPHNSSISRRIATWCNVMSVSHIVLQEDLLLTMVFLKAPGSGCILTYYPSSSLLRSHFAMQRARALDLDTD